MKVAVCLSGHPRTFEKNIGSFKKAFPKADFFFSTWDSEESYCLPRIFEESGLELRRYEFVSEPMQLVRERKILERFKGGHPDFFIFNQWYGVKRSLSLALECQTHSGECYDWYVRARFDLSLEFEFGVVLKNSINAGLNFVPSKTGGSDQFLFGGKEIMEDFLTFENWLESYPDEFGSEYGFHASPLVKAFFLSRGIPVNKILAPQKVVRPYKEKPQVVRETRTFDYIGLHFPDLIGTVWEGSKGTSEAAQIKPAPWDDDFYPGTKLVYKMGA